MEAYLSVAIVFAIWALCVFIESKRGSHTKGPAEPLKVSDVDYVNVGYDPIPPRVVEGEVNPNTSAKKRKRQRKQSRKRTLEQG